MDTCSLMNIQIWSLEKNLPFYKVQFSSIIHQPTEVASGLNFSLATFCFTPSNKSNLSLKEENVKIFCFLEKTFKILQTYKKVYCNLVLVCVRLYTSVTLVITKRNREILNNRAIFCTLCKSSVKSACRGMIEYGPLAKEFCTTQRFP